MQAPGLVVRMPRDAPASLRRRAVNSQQRAKAQAAPENNLEEGGFSCLSGVLVTSQACLATSEAHAAGRLPQLEASNWRKTRVAPSRPCGEGSGAAPASCAAASGHMVAPLRARLALPAAPRGC